MAWRHEYWDLAPLTRRAIQAGPHGLTVCYVVNSHRGNNLSHPMALNVELLIGFNKNNSDAKQKSSLLEQEEKVSYDLIVNPSSSFSSLLICLYQGAVKVIH